VVVVVATTVLPRTHAQPFALLLTITSTTNHFPSFTSTTHYHHHHTQQLTTGPIRINNGKDQMVDGRAILYCLFESGDSVFVDRHIGAGKGE